jgi:diadenosine tetraphosphate (Ap4A) HIT family hydrolase
MSAGFGGCVMTAPGWPANWDERVAGKDCPLCRELGLGDNEFSVYVWQGRHAEVRLPRRTAVPGYCTVVWDGHHVADPADLPAADSASYWEDVLHVSRAVRSVFEPVKINYLLLGNLVPHLHTHVVPRYRDDPAAGGPISWETLVAPPPTPTSVLHDQAGKLRAALSSDGS